MSTAKLNTTLAFDKNNPVLKFDYAITNYSPVTVDQNITVLSDLTDAVDFFGGGIIFTGDGTHALNMSGYTKIGSLNFDNTTDMMNHIRYWKDGPRIYYQIFDQHIQDSTAPLIQSALAGAIDDSTIELTYDEALDSSSTPSTTDYVITKNASPVTISGVVVSGLKVTITIATTVSGLDTVLLNYTPGVNKLRDLAQNNAIALTNYAVDYLAQTILDTPGVVRYFSAENNSQFTLSGTNITAWIDKCGNSNLEFSGGYRTYQLANKRVYTSATNQILQLPADLDLNNTYTIVLYENLDHKNATSTFMGSNTSPVRYIGDVDTGTYQHAANTGVVLAINYYDHSNPAGLKKHVIRRDGANDEWKLNGQALTKTQNEIGSNPTAKLFFRNLGWSTFVCTGYTHAVVLFNRSLTDNEVNIVLGELDGLLGV